MVDTLRDAIGQGNGLVSKGIDLVVYLFALFCAYIIFGGMLLGETTAFPGAHPVIPIVSLLLVIGLIGALEGLQISVATLWQKDLRELREAYPNAYTLHRVFKDNQRITKRFLAGRQLLLVALVFIASRLTIFPELTTIPFTGVSLPVWFRILFLDFGLLGAIFVYWLGNLLAQLYATDFPITFLDKYIMKYFFNLCLFVDAIRLPLPSKTLTELWTLNSTPEGRIPVSSEEKYHREKEIDRGWGIERLKHTWLFSPDETRATFEIVFEMGRDGVEELTHSVVFPPEAGNITFESYSLLPPARMQNGAYQPELDVARRSYKGWDEGPSRSFLSFTVADPQGSFRAGDRVKISGEVSTGETPPEFGQDTIRIDYPVKELVLGFEFDDRTASSDLSIQERHPISTRSFQPGLDAANSVEKRIEYPREGTRYLIKWT